MTEFGLSYLYHSYSELAEPGIKTGTLWFLGECASNCAIQEYNQKYKGIPIIPIITLTILIPIYTA